MLNERGTAIKIEKPEEQQIAELKKELFDRECPKEYEPLIAGVQLIEKKERYAENLRPKLEKKELAELIRNKFKDEKVLDLGCGQTSDMWIVALQSGADLYIGVDLDPWVQLMVPDGSIKISDINPWSELSATESGLTVENVEKEAEEKYEYKPRKIKEPKYEIRNSKSTTEAFEITDDMLRAISRFKDNSIGVIIISGIEAIGLLTEEGKINRQYLVMLQTEIKRVLKPDGILINYYSDISAGGLSSIAHGAGDDLHIFEKK